MSNTLLTRFSEQLWADPDSDWPWYKFIGLRLAQFSVAMVRGLTNGELSMRAMSLVYTTLLSLVPLLALSFSMLKAFGVHNSMEPAMRSFLAPLGGEEAQKLTTTIIDFADNIQVGVLGATGIALLLYTAISMLQKVETSFNFIWQIDRSRTFAQRFSQYLSVLIVGPVVVFSALGLTASAVNDSTVEYLATYQVFGWFLVFLQHIMPFVMIVGAFTFLYSFIPNTKVKLRAAIAGGLFAGVLWELSSVAFAQFVSGASNYNAIYSGFAIVLFLLIWLYVGWLILLVGCQLAFLVHYPGLVKPKTETPYIGNRSREYLVLLVMTLVGRRFMTGDPPINMEQVAEQSGEMPQVVFGTVERLIHAGYLVETEGVDPVLVPSRDLSTIQVRDMLAVIRDDHLATPRTPRANDSTRTSMSVVEQLENAIHESVAGMTLRDLVLGPPIPPPS